MKRPLIGRLLEEALRAGKKSSTYIPAFVFVLDGIVLIVLFVLLIVLSSTLTKEQIRETLQGNPSGIFLGQRGMGFIPYVAPD